MVHCDSKNVRMQQGRMSQGWNKPSWVKMIVGEKEKWQKEYTEEMRI